VKPGIYSIPMAWYLAFEALSASLCHELLTCSPAHAKHRQAHPSEPSTESDIGTAIHDVLLEGRDRIVPIDAPDWRTKAAKEARELARAQGGIPMLAHKVAQIEAAVKQIKAFVAETELARIFEKAEVEQTLIWEEPCIYRDAAGIICKARPDLFTARWHVSVKTTAGSAEPSSWIRNHLVPSGYDVSAAFYERGFRMLKTQYEPSYAPSTVFLVAEQAPPHGCSLIALSPDMYEIAHKKVERAIRIWQECQHSGKWPAYPAQICYAEPTPWQLAEQEERDLNRTYDALQMKEGLQA